MRTPAGDLLIDFEEAEWRPVVWDVAYLTVPWPSCWCCFSLPAEVTRQALDRYRSVAAGRLRYLGTPAFDHDVALATAGWAMVSSSWFLAGLPVRTRGSTARSRRSTRPASCRRAGRSSPTAWRPRSAPKACPPWPAWRGASAPR